MYILCEVVMHIYNLLRYDQQYSYMINKKGISSS